MTRQEQEEAEQAAYEEHMQALYDEQNWMQQMTEQVEQLQGENDVLRAKLEATQRERDHFRDAWAKAQVRLDCGADATEAVQAERAAVVAWLRSQVSQAAGPGDLDLDWAADAIEAGVHRPGGDP